MNDQDSIGLLTPVTHDISGPVSTALLSSGHAHVNGTNGVESNGLHAHAAVGDLHPQVGAGVVELSNHGSV